MWFPKISMIASALPYWIEAVAFYSLEGQTPFNVCVRLCGSVAIHAFGLKKIY
jgi:hypothetical protein